MLLKYMCQESVYATALGSLTILFTSVWYYQLALGMTFCEKQRKMVKYYWANMNRLL